MYNERTCPHVWSYLQRVSQATERYVRHISSYPHDHAVPRGVRLVNRVKKAEGMDSIRQKAEYTDLMHDRCPDRALLTHAALDGTSVDIQCTMVVDRRYKTVVGKVLNDGTTALSVEHTP